MRHRIPLQSAVWVVMALLSGCTALGLAPAMTFEDRLAYANGTATGLLRGTTAALNANQIKRDDAKFMASVSDEAAELLDAAELAAGEGDLKTAEGRLILAQSVLDKLDAYLKQKAKP